MKTGTARYAKHYEIAAYGESAVRWGYNHWWSKTFLLGFSTDTFKNLGRTTEADVISGWGVASAIHDVINAKTKVRSDNTAPTCLSPSQVTQHRSDAPSSCHGVLSEKCVLRRFLNGLGLSAESDSTSNAEEAGRPDWMSHDSKGIVKLVTSGVQAFLKRAPDPKHACASTGERT
jgi:hypothetical protein